MNALRAPQGYYAASAGPLPRFEALRGSARADVCVMGAGYTGLVAALALARSGARTILLEAETVGFGASGRNGGQIHSGHRWDQRELERWLGDGHARDLWQIAEQGKALVHRLADLHVPDAGLKSGLIVAAHNDAALRGLAIETEHLNRHYSYHQAKMLSRDEIAAQIGTNVYAGGRYDAGGGHLHPLRYALGLAKAAAESGVVIHEHSRVTAAEPSGNEILVQTREGAVRADTLLVATDAFSGSVFPELAPYIGHVESFIAATEPLSMELCAAIIPSDCAVADTRHVLDYYRKSADGRLLFAGRESYWSVPKDIARLVRPRMLRVFPALEDVRIEFSWSGTVGITYTRMPHFGRIGERVLFAHGYSGHGVALASVGGKILAAAALGKSPEFETLAAVPARPFPGPNWARKTLIAAGLLWYKFQDAL